MKKNKKIKILMLTTVMAPYRIDLFNELGKHENIDLTVCFEQINDISRNENWYKKDFKYFKSIILKDANKSLNHIKFDFLRMINNNYDCVIFYEYSTITSFFSIIKCRLKKIKYLINCDGAIDKGKSFKDFIKKFCISKANVCLANGKNAKEYFVKYGANSENIYLHKFSSIFKNEILKDIISKKEKEELRKKLNLDYDVIYLSVGSFIYRKGFDLLLRAVNDFKSKKKVGFIVIGGGEEKENYQKYILEKNISNVEFVDFISKDKIIDYYDAADVFLFPTREDIWGLVINEAMSRGLPVISTNMCVAALELVDNTNGRIIPSEDFDSLKEVLVEFDGFSFSDFSRMGRSSLNKISEYNIENLAKSHIEALKRL